jgi:flagellar hook-associated protein 1 FlgK
VTASFNTTSQTVVFTRDPNNGSLAQQAQQGANPTTSDFTITDSLGAGVTTQKPQGANSTFLLQALGAAGINGVDQNAGNASAIGDNSGANALLQVFSNVVGIGALQTTSATAVAAPGSVTISPPAPGAFATVQVGQQLTIAAGTPAQENVTVTAINLNTGTITATFANAHPAGFSITTTPTQTIGAAYGALITQQATDLQTATTGTTTQTSLASSIDSARQSVDGINVDEETQNLIKYQSAYEAAAKTVDTINQVLQDLITLGNDTVSAG